MLSAERDPNRLLDEILNCVMELARCDGGTLYLLDGDVLRFKIMRTDSMGTHSGGDGHDPDLPPVKLRRENVCALSLLEDRTVRIEDVYHDPTADFSGPIAYDALTGYHTQSMLVVPLRGREGERIGVLQLINALDEEGNICAFSEEMVLVLESVASQAAVTIQTVRYIREIRELFRSFVRVMSAAIDERSPYNANHSRHMAECGGRFADYLNAQADAEGRKRPFSPARREEFVMSIWLHDIGKLITPLEVMDKAERLSPMQKQAIHHRLETIRLRGRIDCLEGRITQEARDALEAETRETEQTIDQLGAAGFLPDEKLAWLASVRERTYTDEDGQERPWLTEEEYKMLSIRKGTLSPEERKVMENHVVVTDKLLSQIKFPAELSHVRQWAASHHELLNGSGYPNHLSGDEIPTEVRILTILDVFDALVADDRPYKPGMPVEKAVSILESMANREGKLDPDLMARFRDSRCWEGTVKEKPKVS